MTNPAQRISREEWLRSQYLWHTDPYGILRWTIQMGLKTEDGIPLDWEAHRFLIEPLCDLHPRQVTMKCTQIGKSIADILKATFLAQVMGRRIIYTMPTKTLLDEFHKTKIDRLYQQNPAIAPKKGATIGVKQWDRGYLLFRGTMGEQQAIALSADTLMFDEPDTSNQHVLAGLRSRTDRAIDPYFWWSGNPWRPNMGLDTRWQQSDQRRWFVTCPDCGTEQAFAEDISTWDRNLDRKRKLIICWKCKSELTGAMRSQGRWKPTKQGEGWRGYHFSQLMSPWKTGYDILESENEMTADLFCRFGLGHPYAGAESGVDPDMILRACTSEKPVGTRRYMGVDVGAGQHIVIGTETGITRLEYITSRDKDEILAQIGRLMVQEDVRLCVIDNAPTEFQKELQLNFPGKVVRCIYDYDEKGHNVWWRKKQDRGVVYADRTRIIDKVIGAFVGGGIDIHLETTHQYVSQPHMAGAQNCLYDHWQAIYESGVTGDDINVVKKDRTGNVIRTWEASGPDHWVHACVYYWLARTLGGGPNDEKGTFIPGETEELRRRKTDEDEPDDQPAGITTGFRW